LGLESQPESTTSGSESRKYLRTDFMTIPEMIEV